MLMLIYIGIKQKWNIFEKIRNITGTSADIEEVAAMDMTKVDLVPDENNINVPVPKGYVLSGASDEKDITKGAVIYEGEAAVTDDNVATAKTTRNQFVWVPVSATNVSRIYKEDSYGRKTGKLYRVTSSEKREIFDGGRNRLYEPIKYISDENGYQRYNLYGYTKNRLVEESQRNYDETIESIKIYGGFYVGRYETGNLSQRKPVCVQYNNDISGQTWYTMYNKAQYVGANENVKTMMIFGSLWDEMGMWYKESSGSSNYYTTKFSGGNLADSVFNYYPTANSKSTVRKYMGTEIMPTGVNVEIIPGQSDLKNKNNNIYDLSGNVHDGTQEIRANDKYVTRCACAEENSASDRYYAYLTDIKVEDKIDTGEGGVWMTGSHYLGCRLCLIIH